MPQWHVIAQYWISHLKGAGDDLWEMQYTLRTNVSNSDAGIDLQ